MSDSPRRNIELKARLADPAAALRIAEGLATSDLGTMRQVDTYFHCASGRLKLRERDGRAAELIAYQRGDQPQPKASDYRLVPVPDAAALQAALAAALGVRAVVSKQRRVLLWNNVRIHLDEVQLLGSFLEFEAVLADDMDDRRGHAQLAELSARFGIEPRDLESRSYVDLLESARRS